MIDFIIFVILLPLIALFKTRYFYTILFFIIYPLKVYPLFSSFMDMERHPAIGGIPGIIFIVLIIFIWKRTKDVQPLFKVISSWHKKTKMKEKN